MYYKKLKTDDNSIFLSTLTSCLTYGRWNVWNSERTVQRDTDLSKEFVQFSSGVVKQILKMSGQPVRKDSDVANAIRTIQDSGLFDLTGFSTGSSRGIRFATEDVIDTGFEIEEDTKTVSRIKKAHAYVIPAKAPAVINKLKSAMRRLELSIGIEEVELANGLTEADVFRFTEILNGTTYQQWHPQWKRFYCSANGVHGENRVKYFRFDGEPLAELDCKSCQPYVLGLHAKEQGIEGANKWLDACRTGELYAGVEKLKLIKFLNWKNEFCYRGKVANYLKAHHPHIYNFIHCIKKNDHKDMTRLLHYGEWKIVHPFLREAFRHTNNVISTFDGLMVPLSVADAVYGAMLDNNPSGIVITRKDGQP